jgi:hypothetical protein
MCVGVRIACSSATNFVSVSGLGFMGKGFAQTKVQSLSLFVYLCLTEFPSVALRLCSPGTI